MLTFETYRDVLTASAHRGHIVSSGWILAAALSIAIILFV